MLNPPKTLEKCKTVCYTVVNQMKRSNKMKNQKVSIEISNKTTSEWGYGKYINGLIDDRVWAWECLPKSASDEDVKAAARRVRARALYAYKKYMG